MNQWSGILPEEEIKTLKQKALYWANQYDAFLLLDNNGYQHPYQKLQWMLGVAKKENCYTASEQTPILSNLPLGSNLMGHLSYDYRLLLNRKLKALQCAYLPAKDWSFFEPEILLKLTENSLEISTSKGINAKQVKEEILQTPLPIAHQPAPISWTYSKSKEAYLKDIEAIKQHIVDGDCYELNYCVERTGTVATTFDVLQAWQQYNARYPAPFAACYKQDSQYICSGSPERFLAHHKGKLIAQPIKGTARRGNNLLQDQALKDRLLQSEKERAEHVMIVDLLRNDLALSTENGTVEVEELYGIYTYPQVHQMISTITGRPTANTPWYQMVENAFPMGSMTGAPKLKVMQLIDQYEGFARGLFSGCLGYVTSSGDFDFNVLIRTFFYDQSNGKISYATGGAITYDSDPLAEYDEMILKGLAIESLFAS